MPERANRNSKGVFMHRLILAAVLTVATSIVGAPVALAGSPHFVDDTVTVTRTGDSLLVSGKEADLGDES